MKTEAYLEQRKLAVSEKVILAFYVKEEIKYIFLKILLCFINSPE